MADREAQGEQSPNSMDKQQNQEEVEEERKDVRIMTKSYSCDAGMMNRPQGEVIKKPVSPFAKFRQLDKQHSLNSPPSTPKTPTTPSSGGALFTFTDPNLSRSAATIKERLLTWAQMKTHKYNNVKLENFSTSWADGLAFCALVHHFLPDAFDYDKLIPQNRRHNFNLAFDVAYKKADIYPLLDVDDMVATRKPDWKCVFTYVQSIYRRFKDED